MKYIDNFGCMLEEGHDAGDALWRTSLAFICYPHRLDLFKGLVKCTAYRLRRHPLWTRDDCSRDQAVMACVAFHLNGYALPELRYRISEAAVMRDAYLWYIALKNKGRFKGVALNLLWRVIAFFTLWFMPGYAIHLWAWQVYTSGNTPVLNLAGRLRVGRKNLLIRKLLGGKVSDSEIDLYVPHEDFMWQRNERGTVRMSTLRETPHERYPIDKDILRKVI